MKPSEPLLPPEAPVEGLLASLDLLKITRVGQVLHLRLDRPAKRNAISDELMRQLHTALLNLPGDVAALQAVGLREVGVAVLEPGDLAFYKAHIETIVEEEIRLMITKVAAGRSLDEIKTVALHVEEMSDELRRILHAKLLRQAAHRLADQLREEFGGRW